MFISPQDAFPALPQALRHAVTYTDRLFFRARRFFFPFSFPKPTLEAFFAFFGCPPNLLSFDLDFRTRVFSHS